MSRYKKPTIKSKKVYLNFFTSERFFDSFDSLFRTEVYAVTSCSSACFISGTKILMKDGSLKQIEKLQKGELVVSYNIKTNTYEPEKLEQIVVHPDTENGFFIINESVKVTANHRLWLNNVGWERVDAIRIGDQLFDMKSQYLDVSKLEKVDGVFTTYNLHLQGRNHNFFADGILAHNGDDSSDLLACCCGYAK